MSSNTFNNARYSLALIVRVAVWVATLLAHQAAASIPEPCDQLKEAEYQDLCAGFLADGDSSEGLEFDKAATVGDYRGFRSGLEDEKQGGLILLLTNDISLNASHTLFPKGVVAIVGNPQRMPLIRIASDKGQLTSVALGHSHKHFVNPPPRGLCSWGVHWELGGKFRNIILGGPHYGIIRITHSHFSYTRPIRERSAAYYLWFNLEDTPGETIKNDILVAHNRFLTIVRQSEARLAETGEPGWFVDSANINVYCHQDITATAASTCQQLGEVVIRDNLWLPVDSGSDNPEAPDILNHQVAVVTDSIARMTFSGNRALGSGASASLLVIFYYPYNGNGTAVFKNLDLQLTDNIASPEGDAIQHQFYLDGETFLGEPFPLEGLVNITNNSCFDIVQTGGFAPAEGAKLTIIKDNNPCHSITPSALTVAISSTRGTTSLPISVLSVSTPVPSSIMPSATPSTIQPTGSYFSTVGISPSSHSATHSGNKVDTRILAGSIAGGAALLAAATGWGLFWTMIYRKAGNPGLRRFANAMLMCVPACLSTLQSRISAEEDLRALMPTAE